MYIDDETKKELDKIKIEEDIESEFDSIIGNDYDSPTVLTSNQFKKQYEEIKRWVSKCQNLQK